MSQESVRNHIFISQHACALTTRASELGLSLVPTMTEVRIPPIFNHGGYPDDSVLRQVSPQASYIGDRLSVGRKVNVTGIICGAHSGAELAAWGMDSAIAGDNCGPLA